MERLIALAAERALEVLGRGRKILILGGRDTNFDAEVRSDERLVFWDSTDPASRRPRPLPLDVGCVLLTRFIDHASSGRLQKDATAQGGSCIGPLPTGRINTLLKEAFAELDEEKAETTSEVTTQTARPDYSDLPMFLVDSTPPSLSLSSDLLDSAEHLAKLQQAAAEFWPGVSARRIKRALRHGLFEMGVLTPDIAEATVAEVTEETPSVPLAELEAAKLQFKKVREELRKSENERNGLKEQNRQLGRKLEKAREELEKKLKEELEEAGRKLRNAKKDLTFIVNLFVDYLRPVIASGTRIAFRSEQNQLNFDRLVREHATP